MYHHRGFNITGILADREFKALRPKFQILNTTVADKHVPDIERCIRTVKERSRSYYNILPFKFIP
eukprot:7539400-Ditylum_brightwellii.AAC.1